MCLFVQARCTSWSITGAMTFRRRNMYASSWLCSGGSVSRSQIILLDTAAQFSRCSRPVSTPTRKTHTRAYAQPVSFVFSPGRTMQMT
jgi:hypothetical protein